MKTITKFRNYLSLLILFAVIGIASSQSFAASGLSAMQVTTFSGNYTPLAIQPGSVQLAGYAGVYYFGTPYTLSMPFAFTLDGTNFSAGSTLYIYSGSASFTSFQPYYYPVLSPNTPLNFGYTASQWPYTMAPLSGLQMNGGLYYLISGSAPNRVLTIEWYQCGNYSTRSLGTCSYQLKMYEGTNQIEFIYEKYNQSFLYSSSYILTYGINGGNSPVFTQVNLGTSSNTSSPSTNFRFTNPLPVELSTSPKTLNFGPLPTGANGTLTVNIKNVGSGNGLLINSLTVTGSSDFTVIAGTPIPALAAGQTWPITVQFAPSGNGARNAVLSIASNGLDSGLQTINMNGSGVSALISVDSVVRFKKTRTKLGDSYTQWIHITSTGQAFLSFNSFPITGIDADQYYISSFPSNPIQPGNTDSLAITYVPTREGKHVATLTINSTAFNSPNLAISLQGTGTLPHIVLTPTIILFDSTREGDTICKNVSIWNPGTDTLRIKSNFLSSNDGDFHYTPLSATDVIIPPDHTSTVSICFIPIQQGTRQARLLLKTNIIPTFDLPRQDTSGIITLDIRGTGVPFGVFGNSISGLPVLDSALIGSQVCRTDTLMNNGDADILVTGSSINGSQFTANGLPAFPFVLRARSSKTFSLCGTPDKQGLISGSMNFVGKTGGSTIGLNLLLGVFGQKACVSATPNPLFAGVVLPNNGSDSTQCVMVINCGDLTAVYSPTISGAAKADYTFKPAVSAPIKKGDTAIFCIDYKPTAVSSVPPATASFDVTSSDKSSTSVPLVGADGCAVLTNSAPLVPNTGVLAKGKFDITITNGGTFDWTAGTPSVTPNDGVFSVLSLDKPTATASNGAIVAHMQFAPTVLGNATAKLTFPNAGPCGNTVSIDLSGTGVVNSVSETASEGFTLNQSYPNPTHGNANFTYITPKETEVRITLVDLTGKFIRTLISGRVSEGEHTVNFDASNMPSGTYMYVLESGSTRLIRQLILAK